MWHRTIRGDLGDGIHYTLVLGEVVRGHERGLSIRDGVGPAEHEYISTDLNLDWYHHHVEQFYANLSNVIHVAYLNANRDIDNLQAAIQSDGFNFNFV